MAKNSQFPFVGSLLSPYFNHFPYQAPMLCGQQAHTHLKLPLGQVPDNYEQFLCPRECVIIQIIQGSDPQETADVNLLPSNKPAPTVPACYHLSPRTVPCVTPLGSLLPFGAVNKKCLPFIFQSVIVLYYTIKKDL